MLKLSPFNPRKIPGCALHLDACQGITAVDIPAWVTSTVYAVGTRVVQSATYYQCATAHTSGTFATDLAAVKWVATTDGATQVCSAWADQATNARNASQATARYRPAYVTNALNGKPVLRFDGVNDYLTGVTTAVVKSYTAFAVSKRDGGSSPVVLYDTSDSASGYGFGYSVTTTKFETIALVATWGNDYAQGNTETNGYGIGTFLRDTNGYMNVWTNGGNLVTDTSVINANINYNGTAAVYIGYNGFSSQRLAGDIAEIIIYPSALTDNQRKQVELYLSRKWNVSVTI